MRLVLIILIFLTGAGGALAVQPDEVLSDPALENRAREISAHLRCMVCQNQSIDDSDATLARDLRLLVRERLVAGDSDDAVVQYMVDRYGEFVLLEPRFHSRTWLLWLAPLFLLLIGAIVMWRRLKSSDAATPEALSSEEQRALDKILGES